MMSALFKCAQSELRPCRRAAGGVGCNGSPFSKATEADGGPTGWITGSYVENPLVESEAAKIFRAAMEVDGQSKWISEFSNNTVFTDLFAIAKWANAIGPTKLAPAAFEEQIKAWEGPGLFVPGHIHCLHNTEYLGLCGDSGIGSEYKDGKWVSLEAVKNITLTSEPVSSK